MARRADVVLREIIVALDELEAALAGQTATTFKHQWFLQRGTERAIEIVSEAVRHLPEELLARHPQIDWSDVRAIGNLIRHEYHRVDPDVIWSVVVDDLPALRSAIEAMLKDWRG